MSRSFETILVQFMKKCVGNRCLIFRGVAQEQCWMGFTGSEGLCVLFKVVNVFWEHLVLGLVLWLRLFRLSLCEREHERVTHPDKPWIYKSAEIKAYSSCQLLAQNISILANLQSKQCSHRENLLACLFRWSDIRQDNKVIYMEQSITTAFRQNEFIVINYFTVRKKGVWI